MKPSKLIERHPNVRKFQTQSAERHQLPSLGLLQRKRQPKEPAIEVLHRAKASVAAKAFKAGAVKESRLAAKLVADVEAAAPSDVKALCEKYRLTRNELGRLTGFSLRAMAEWSAGKLPSEPARRRLHEVRRLLDALADVVRIEVIHQWLSQRNPAFENMTPLQIIEVGEIDRLWQIVFELSSGNLA
jgi:DNA-binding transcriptional regulator YiaG